jgi:hypothetical protein
MPIERNGKQAFPYESRAQLYIQPLQIKENSRRISLLYRPASSLS